MSDENFINHERLQREVYCPKCHIYSFSNEVMPKCYNCRVNLVTVVKSAISGQKITGGVKHDKTS